MVEWFERGGIYVRCERVFEGKTCAEEKVGTKLKRALHIGRRHDGLPVQPES